MRNDPPLVLGLDIGGTSTRCVLADHSGRVIGRGGGGGANVLSSKDPAGSVTGAVRAAIAGHSPDAVRMVAAGAAAAGAGLRGRVLAMLRSGLGAAGVALDPLLVTDIHTAFASATTRGDGIVLIAGTGAVGGVFAAHALTRTSDGHGWLLGDAGSAVWQGRRVARAVLAECDGRGPRTALSREVAELLDPPSPEDPPDLAHRLVAHVHARPPAELGRLAPLVARLAGRDPVAAGIAEEAVRGLLATVEPLLRDAPRPGVVVVGGSVLSSPGPVGDGVRAALRERTGREVLVARDGAAGAAALALRDLPGADSRAHANLIEPSPA